MADIDGLKEAVDMRKYVIKYLNKEFPTYKSSGESIYVKCPFHDDRNPSMILHDKKFKCFGCGKNGDIIDLVRQVHNLDFKDACTEIADNIGFQIIFEQPNQYHIQYREKMLEQCRRYYYNLQNNPDALQYVMKKRRISPQMIMLFMIGLTDREEYKYRQDLGGIGNRIVFPIFDNTAKPQISGASYRCYLQEEQPKYINDANQVGSENQDANLAGVFLKGNLLYGLYQARQAIQDSGYAIITEGYFDVISMHQAGACNTLGLMGARMTEAQADLIAKKTNKVVLMLDADDAGWNGMIHASKLLMSKGIDVSICELKDAHDADELCKKYDYDMNEITKVMKACTKSAVLVIVDRATEKYKSFVVSERTKVLKEMFELIDTMNDVAQKTVLKDIVLKQLDMK